MLRVIVAGSREIVDLRLVAAAIEESGMQIATVISGTARGVDRLGETWAKERGIPIERYPANWERYGRRAGYLRNRQMAEVADAAIILIARGSRGASMMRDICHEKGIPAYVAYVDESDKFHGKDA